MARAESRLGGLEQALAEATPPRRRDSAPQFDLAAVLEEMNAWVDDENQATSAFSSNWVSLVDDALSTLEDCGPKLMDALLARNPGLVEELRSCRTILKRRRQPPDRALTRRLANVAAHLTREIRRGPTLQAAFEDLLRATTAEELRVRAGLLMSVSTSAGHDPNWFPRRLRSILTDDATSIALERGVPVPDEPTGQAGADPEERLELVRAILGEPPATGTAIVWLRFASGKIGSPPVLKLGDRVTLFDDKWLRSVIQDDRRQLEDHAPEAVSDDETLNDIKFLVGDESEEDGDHGESSVFLRVVVEDVTATEARRVARRTGDTLSGIASLYGTRPRLWELDESFVIMTSYGGGGSSFSAPSPPELSVDDRIAVHNDHTGRTLADLSEMLGPHLPVTDSAITHAATLLSWLRRARTTPAAPRLLLCDRVVEQVGGWAGFADPHAFSSEILRLAWAVSRVRNYVADAAFVASDELRRLRAVSVVDKFADSDGSFGGSVNLKSFLHAFPSVLKALDDDVNVVDRRGVEGVRNLAPRLATPAASRAWLNEQLSEFTRNEARRRRTRNALVHGGPLAERTVEATVGFAEALAVLALGDCINGRLAGRDLIDHFLSERRYLDRLLRRLDDGQPLAEVLFWERDDPA